MQTRVPTSLMNNAGSVRSLALTNPMVLEDKTFDIVDGDYDDDGYTKSLPTIPWINRSATKPLQLERIPFFMT